MTGGPTIEVEPGVGRTYDDVAATFFFRIGGHNFRHLVDKLFQNAYGTFQKYHIDVLSVNIWCNAPGGTDEMTPYDAVRLAQAARARVLMPMRWDNLGNTGVGPEEVLWIAKRPVPDLTVVTPQWGVKWVFPIQKDVSKKEYDDWREPYRPQTSWKYGEAGQGSRRQSRRIRISQERRLGSMEPSWRRWGSWRSEGARASKQRLSNDRLFERSVSGERPAAFLLFLDESVSMKRSEKFKWPARRLCSWARLWRSWRFRWGSSVSPQPNSRGAPRRPALPS